MRFRNEEIWNARAAIQRLIEEKLPVKVSYGLAKIANKVNEQLKIIEEVRMGLLRKYGERTESGWEVKNNSEKFGKFMEEVQELLAQEVELVIEKVTLPTEINGELFQLEPRILMALEKFVGIG